MLKYLFLAAFILILGHSQADECVKGPSYWCESIKNANKCNALKHCLQTVWSTHNRFLNHIQLKSSNTPNTCSNCVQCLSTDQSDCDLTHLFKQEIDLLKNSKITNEAICKLLSQCDDEHFSEEKTNDQSQVEYKYDSRFKCGIHPRNWCDNLETAKRCDSFETCLTKWSSLKYKLKESLKETKDNSERTCGFCTFIFQKLQQTLQQNSTEVNVKDYLEGACTLLPAQNLTELCVQQVDKYLPEIYNMLRNNVDPGIICRVLKQCSDAYLEEVTEKVGEKAKTGGKNLIDSISLTVLNDKDVIIKTPLQNDKSSVNSEYLFGPKSQNLFDQLKRSSGVACELCTIVMNAAKHMVENKDDNAKVLNFIEKQLCSRLGSLNSTCVEYVEQEGAEIIQLLIDAVDPSFICHAMGLCLKVQVTGPTEKFYDLNVRNPLNCTLCKVVFNQVKKMLTEQKSQAKILDYVDIQLCQKVGKSKEMCKTLIDAYGPLFLEIIARDVKPDQLCVMIGMCATTDAVSTQVQGSGQNCVICEFFINVLEKFINQNSTIPEIERWMQYVCDHAMPVPVRNECSSFVATYGDLILSLLINNVPPQKVCTFMGLCNKTESGLPEYLEEADLFRHRSDILLQKEKSIAQRVQETRSVSIQCTVCQYAMQYISSEYQVDKTERALEFTIGNVCKLSPKSYRSHCNSIVDEHGVKLITFMERYTDPLRVCGSIKLCPLEEQKPNNIEMSDLVPAKPTEPKVDDNSLVDTTTVSGNKTLACSLCLYVSELVDEKLKQNKTEEEITKELLLVCNLFPAQIKDQCSAFINEYGPYVIQLVANDLDPDVTCAALKLCDKSIEKDAFRRALLNFRN